MEKQAILIIAHNNFEILKKTISFLDSEYFDIYVHIDKKSSIALENINIKTKLSKLFIYKEIDVRWADFSQVECELFILEKALLNGSYNYYHLISGVDLPLRKPKEIYDFFESHTGKEFIHFSSEKMPLKKLDWIKYYYCFGRISRKFIYKLLDKISIVIQKCLFINRTRKYSDIKFMTGANWFSITENLAKYVMEKKMELKKMFAFTRSADEVFLQTLVYNSEFVNHLFYDKFDDNFIACMRLIDWERGNPYVFKREDIKLLLNSEYMFARKFDENIDKDIIDLLLNKIK